MGILPGTCVCVLYTCLVLQEMRVGYWSPWNCNYRWLWANVGNRIQLLWKINHRAISSV